LRTQGKSSDARLRGRLRSCGHKYFCNSVFVYGISKHQKSGTLQTFEDRIWALQHSTHVLSVSSHLCPQLSALSVFLNISFRMLGCRLCYHFPATPGSNLAWDTGFSVKFSWFFPVLSASTNVFLRNIKIHFPAYEAHMTRRTFKCGNLCETSACLTACHSMMWAQWRHSLLTSVRRSGYVTERTHYLHITLTE
jgi:hypothetical protein